MWAFQQKKGNEKRYPPGPRGVPVLGILPFLGDSVYLTFSRMAEQFGAVFQVYMGSRRTVVINGAEAARQVSVGLLSATNVERSRKTISTGKACQ